jgi:PEP-CTERM motif
MFKFLRLRLLTLAACCLFFPAAAHAGPVTIGFGVNNAAFSFTLGGFHQGATYEIHIQSFWDIDLRVQEIAGAVDMLNVQATVRHIIAPHGELPGLVFAFMPGNVGLIGTGIVVQPGAAALPHFVEHIDNYTAVLSFNVNASQIGLYTLHLEGMHCNQCPVLPQEVEIPEPATLLLLGSGLAGVAIKTRKRFKSRKTG